MGVCMVVLVSCIFEWRDGNEEERRYDHHGESFQRDAQIHFDHVAN